MTSIEAKIDFLGDGDDPSSCWRAARLMAVLSTHFAVVTLAVAIFFSNASDALAQPPVQNENIRHSLDNLLRPNPRPTVEWPTSGQLDSGYTNKDAGAKSTAAMKASTRTFIGSQIAPSELGLQEQSLGEAAGLAQDQNSAQRLVTPSFDPIKVFNESASGGPVIDPTGRRPNQFQEEGRSGGFLPSGQSSPREPIRPAPFSLDNFPSTARTNSSDKEGGSETNQNQQDEVIESLPEAIESRPQTSPPTDRGGAEVPRAAPRRETIVENYPNGKPRVYREVAMDEEGNYYKDGIWRAVDLQGNEVAKGTYRKGLMEGQWGRRHLSSEGGMFATKPFTSYQGPFDSYAFFKNGLLDGQWVIYSADRRSIFEIGYKNGKRHGEAVWYYPDRQKMRTATFKDGVLDGEVLEWDEDNRLVLRDRYYEGRKVVRTTAMYRPEQKKSETFFLDARLEPEGLDNWWEAKPAPFVSTGARVQNGPVRNWYPNQQLRYSGQYKDDRPIGQFFWWHENGIRKTVGFYNEEGERSGRWIWWHENGMKQIEGSYLSGEPAGLWRSWLENGQLEKERNYDEERNDFFGGNSVAEESNEESGAGSGDKESDRNEPQLNSPTDVDSPEPVGELPAPRK